MFQVQNEYSKVQRRYTFLPHQFESIFHLLTWNFVGCFSAAVFVVALSHGLPFPVHLLGNGLYTSHNFSRFFFLLFIFWTTRAVWHKKWINMKISSSENLFVPRGGKRKIFFRGKEKKNEKIDVVLTFLLHCLFGKERENSSRNFFCVWFAYLRHLQITACLLWLYAAQHPHIKLLVSLCTKKCWVRGRVVTTY